MKHVFYGVLFALVLGSFAILVADHFFAVPDPAPGEVWELPRPTSGGNPFHESTRFLVRIVEVRSGWVRYEYEYSGKGPGSRWFVAMELRIPDFLRSYRKVSP